MPLAAILQIVQIIAGVSGAAVSGQKLIEGWARDHPEAPVTDMHVQQLAAVAPHTAAVVQSAMDLHDHMSGVADWVGAP